MRPILVAGTDSWKGDATVPRDQDWFYPRSAFAEFLTAQGYGPTFAPRGPFVWSTDLGGVPWARFRDWQAGGAALAYFTMSVAQRAGRETAVIAHSHGLQVALFACADQGLKIQTLISVGSPVRRDMLEIARQARPNIGYWLHLHSDASDRWQWLGELGDGGWRDWIRGGRILREHPLADRNDFVPGVGHTDLLRNPRRFHYWIERGWLDPLKGVSVPPSAPANVPVTKGM